LAQERAGFGEIVAAVRKSEGHHRILHAKLFLELLCRAVILGDSMRLSACRTAALLR
jgi:hypothetical protein